MADLTRPSLPEQLCAREPIHIPGSIQPHGWMLALNAETLVVEQLSANWGALLGGDAARFASRPVEEIDGPLAAQIRGMAQVEQAAGAYRATLAGQTFDVVQHRSNGAWIVELEPAAGDAFDFVGLQERQGLAVARLQAAGNVQELCRVAASEMAALCGYDRVMIYRFHPDWHGEVVAEWHQPDLEPFLGLHYPASDIPEQARRLYTQNWMRLIVTADYKPALLVPTLNPRTGQPLDLTHSSLRSVSPVHLQYLRNMGVDGSMSVSLIESGKLWGLVACHHRRPRRLPVGVRLACELVGRVTSALLGAAERAAVQEARLAAKAAREGFLDQLAEHLDFVQALTEQSADFLGVMNARSAVVAMEHGIRTLGEPLPPGLAEACLAWLRNQPHHDFIATDRLADVVPAAQGHGAGASGLFAIALTETSDEWLVWFRQEHSRLVNWAGNPDKSLQDLALPIQPRKSFALWTQQVTETSAPWTDLDEATAIELRAAVNASIRKRTEHLLRLNEELVRKNSDLNSFAFIASHDLREPLRGVRNILEFIREDHGPALPEQAQQDLGMAARTAERMHEMLDSLLHYTRIGRAEFATKSAPLGEIIDRALEMARPQWGRKKVHVEVEPNLPAVKCDRVMMAEVFTNLLTNAVKYNLNEEKRIEIFTRPCPDGVEVAVRDNGIGIDTRHFNDVFTIFRRLHPRDQFSGGLGVGLAVVKSIIERHGGTVHVESAKNVGTTFVIKLDT